MENESALPAPPRPGLNLIRTVSSAQIHSTNKDIFLSTSQHRLRHLCEQINLQNFQDAKKHLTAGNQGDEGRDFVT